jgi:hypothetical protein
MMIEICSSRLHFSNNLFCLATDQADASERGSGQTEPLALGSVALAAPSLGRFHGTFELRYGANLHGFCLAWISGHHGPPALSNRSNPQHAWFPGIPLG